MDLIQQNLQCLILYSKGDQPIQKLEDKTLLASSSITYVVNRLEKKR